MKTGTRVLVITFSILLLAGLALGWYSFRAQSPQGVAETISRNLDTELKRIDAEAQGVLSSGDPTIGLSAKYRFLVFDRNGLNLWSDNSFIPSLASVSDTFTIKLVKDGNSEYLLRKWPMDGQRFLVGVITLHRSYKIVNDYLKPEWNAAIFPSQNIDILDANASIGVPVCTGGQCVFRISFLPDELPVHQDAKKISIALILLSLVVLLMLIYRGAERISSRYYELRFLYLYGAFVAIRFLMIRLDFPNNMLRTELFNAQVFASSTFNASLGDLIVNLLALLALCYYLFRHYPHVRIFHYLNTRKVGKWGLSILSALCIHFAMLFPFVTLQTIYNNSSIVLDISQSLDFGGLRIMATLAVLLAGACAFLFAHVFVRLLVGDKKTLRIYISFAIGTLLFALINETTGQFYVSSLIIGTFYFFTVYLLSLYGNLKRFSYATFGYLFVGVFFLSLSGSYAVHLFSHREKIEKQFSFASNFLIDRDYFGEYLLRESSQKIAGDFFIQMRMVSPFLGRDAIRQKIRQVFLPSYFNKYDVLISLFNSSGEPMDNNTPQSLSAFIGLYETEAFRTPYPGVFFVNNPQADVTQKYVMVVPVKRLNATAGHIVVELSLKKVIPESVYPELLVDNSFQQFYRTQDLSYAVFSGKQLQFTSGDFNYEGRFQRDLLGDEMLYTKGVRDAGYDHIAQEDQSGRLAVVSSRSEESIYDFANFSFWFVMGLAIILMLIAAQGVVNYAGGDNLFFSARIQLILNLAFFLPLILVSATTLSLTSRSSKQQLDAEYLNKAKAFAQQFANTLGESADNRFNGIESELTDLTKLSTLDANIYGSDGLLTATSQPLIFESGIISGYINPVALRKIRSGENLFIEQERIGNLDYFVAYAALKSPQTGKRVGIIGIPFFQSAYLLEKVQVIVLANILTIFAAIFIVLLVLSYFVSKWLIFPLTFITQSLQRTSLTRTNQPITWNANDEIGLMAKEYNQMLYNLSESKAELEQTQRERTWREIAQQVAHEIKNPLTPMKLTLQQLERSVQQGTNTPEKTEKVLSSLLGQVDTLSDIASSFSSFARMPEPVIQRLELAGLLKRIVELHSQSGDLEYSPSQKEVYVMADEQLLGRTFSNIILNGLQAARPGVASKIEITLEKTGSMCRVTFRDNGKGIEPAIAERVFMPHFSTKKSGSGLGLAIARQAIEQMKGKIWFETKVGKGTSFFIELPVVEP